MGFEPTRFTSGDLESPALDRSATVACFEKCSNATYIITLLITTLSSYVYKP
jgi:hypothetical protein